MPATRPHAIQAISIVCGRPNVAYDTASGAAASRKTAEIAAAVPASSRASSAVAGMVTRKKTSDGTRSPTRPPGHCSVTCSRKKCTGPPPRLPQTIDQIVPGDRGEIAIVTSSSTLTGAHHTAATDNAVARIAAAPQAIQTTRRPIARTLRVAATRRLLVAC
jgi:hypothetical protein